MEDQKEGFCTTRDSACFTKTRLLIGLISEKNLCFLEGIGKSLLSTAKAVKITLLESISYHLSLVLNGFFLNNRRFVNLFCQTICGNVSIIKKGKKR